MLSDCLSLLTSALGAISLWQTAISVGVVLAGIWYWHRRRVIPLLWRLGKTLAARKVAVYADALTGRELEDLLLDSGLFQRGDVKVITGKNNLDRWRDRVSLSILHWRSWDDEPEARREILKNKRPGTAILVYVPAAEEPLGDSETKKINEVTDSVLCNFRGRLLSDVLSALLLASTRIDR